MLFHPSYYSDKIFKKGGKYSMQFSMTQLQALDYLQKLLSYNPNYAINGKIFQLVVKLDEEYWTGDFVNLYGSCIKLEELQTDTQIVTIEQRSPFGSKSLKQFNTICRYYYETLGNHPLRNVSYLPILYKLLKEILIESNVNCSDEDNQLPCYLFNARSINRKHELPFLDLTGKKIELVSMIDVTEQLQDLF